MKVPITLPVVRVTAHDDLLSIAIDEAPYATQLSREDLPNALGDIAAHLASAIRVEITEADGTTYSDIATPSDVTAQRHSLDSAQRSAPGISGTGFLPGEDVAVACVVARQTADPSGTTTFRLPPAAFERCRDAIILIGLTSGITTGSGASA